MGGAFGNWPFKGGPALPSLTDTWRAGLLVGPAAGRNMADKPFDIIDMTDDTYSLLAVRNIIHNTYVLYSMHDAGTHRN